MHAMRRNVDIKILLFNNRIYGLTKGQYSPTSLPGHVTLSTPYGSVDAPLHPLSIALGSEATFVARSVDTHTKHLGAVLRRAAEHRGAALVEIYQNCNVYNDGAFEYAKDVKLRSDTLVELEHGQPIVFGANRDKGDPAERTRARGRPAGQRNGRVGPAGARRGPPAEPTLATGAGTDAPPGAPRGDRGAPRGRAPDPRRARQRAGGNGARPGGKGRAGRFAPSRRYLDRRLSRGAESADHVVPVMSHPAIHEPFPVDDAERGLRTGAAPRARGSPAPEPPPEPTASPVSNQSARIDDAIVERFRRDGVAHLDGAFTEWIEVLRAGVEHNMRSPGPYTKEYEPEGSKGYFFGDYCNWARIPEYRDFVLHSPRGGDGRPAHGVAHRAVLPRARAGEGAGDRIAHPLGITTSPTTASTARRP